MAKDYSMQFNIKAKDEFSPVMKKAAASAEETANKLAGADAKVTASSQRLSTALDNQKSSRVAATKTTADLGKTVSGLPDKFSKSSAILTTFGSASTGMGGQVAGATGKLADMAAVMATGGPIGIAIAGVTGAVAAGTVIWDLHRAPIEAAKNAYKSMSAVVAASTATLLAQEQEIKRINREVEFWGKTSDNARTIELARNLERKKTTIPQYKAEIAAMQARAGAAKKERDELLKSGLTIIKDQEARGLRLQALREEIAGAEEYAKLMQLALPTMIQRIGAEEREAAAIGDRVAKTEADNIATENAARVKENESKARNANAKAIANEARELAKIQKLREQYIDDEAKAQAAARKRGADDRMKSLKLRELKATNANEARAAEELAQAQADERRSTAESTAALARVDLERQTAMTIAGTVAGSLTTMIDSVISGQATMEEAAKAMLASIARTAVNSVVDMAIQSGIKAIFEGATIAAKTAAAGVSTVADKVVAESAVGSSSTVAMAQSLAAYSMIPFLGPELGLAQGLKLVGAIQASRALMLAAEGGIAPFGTDTVPAMLTPGERVLTTRQTSLFERMVSALESGSGRGSDGGGLHVHNATMLPTTSAETMRQLRELDKLQKRRRRIGVV